LHPDFIDHRIDQGQPTMRVIVRVAPSVVEDTFVLHRDLDASFRTVDGDDEPGAPAVADGVRTRLRHRQSEVFQVVAAQVILDLDLEPPADRAQRGGLCWECAGGADPTHPERSIMIPRAVTPASSNTRATFAFARW